MFSKNPLISFVQWEQNCFMWMDRHGAANSRFKQFCGRAE